MAIEGVSLAFGADTLDATPTWTRIDDGVTRVASYSIDRGRIFELDQTDGGRATVAINDLDGTLDPTNSGGPYYTQIDSLVQAGIARWNPVSETWWTRFRGFVAEYDYVYNPAAYLNQSGDVVGVNQLVLSLVDIFDILESALMLDPATFGDTPPSGSEGQIFFDNANVDDRIRQIYGNAGIPDDFFVVFSGNVSLHETTYSPGESCLTCIQEAVDGEHPAVSNFYTDRLGRGVFHGRLAKFDPHGTWVSIGASDAIRDAQWRYRHWKLGDGKQVALSLSDTAQIREFAFNRGVSKIRNYALATPIGFDPAVDPVSAQLATDPTSIGLNGYRTWEKQNLLTESGLADSSTDLEETAKFSAYVVNNYKQSRNRVTHCSIKAMHPNDTRAAANWAMLSECDVADTVEITITNPGEGGFNAEPFFIEGIHEEVTGRIRAGIADGDEGYDNITMSFDLSNQALFTDGTGLT